MHRMHFANDLADFSPIGPDILHGSSTYLPRDEGEIFHAIQQGLSHLCHEVIPLNARANQKVHRILRLTTALYALDHRVEYNTMKIGEEEQIAPLTNSDTATLLEVFVTAQ